MAHEQGILGCEMGDLSGVTGQNATGSDLVSGAARTGNYGFNNKITVATAQRALTWEAKTISSLGSGEVFDFRMRFFFRIVIEPNVTNHVVGGFIGGGVDAAISWLELNTTGGARLNNGSGFTSAYTSNLPLNEWLRADLRTHGFAATSGKTNSARQRTTLDIYDSAGTALYFLITIQSGQTAFIGKVFGSGTPGTRANQSGGDTAWLTVSTKVSGYEHVVTGGGVNGDGSYGFVSAESEVYDGEYSGNSSSGTYIENGILHNHGLVNFYPRNSLGTIAPLQIGQTTGSASTREIHYDDVFWDLRTGSDVQTYIDVGFPTLTKIYPYVVIGQGGYNAFTPAGAWQNVDEVPSTGGTDTVTSSTPDTRTSYLHTPGTGVTSHIRCYSNATGGGVANLLWIGDISFPWTLTGSTGASDTATPISDLPCSPSMTLITFNALEFGWSVGASGTVTIENILLEVLMAPGTDYDADTSFATTTPTFLTSGAGRAAVTSEVVLIVPGGGVDPYASSGDNWALERLDIKNRPEGHS